MLKLPETVKTFAANKTKAKRMQIVELLPAVRNLRMAGLGASGVDGNCLRASSPMQAWFWQLLGRTRRG